MPVAACPSPPRGPWCSGLLLLTLCLAPPGLTFAQEPDAPSELAEAPEEPAATPQDEPGGGEGGSDEGGTASDAVDPGGDDGTASDALDPGGDEPAAEDDSDSIGAEEEEERDDADASRAATAAALRRRRARSRGREESYLFEFLAVGGLLALLLFTRLQKRAATERDEERRGHTRSAPIKPEELGYAVFLAVRDGHLEAYRALFLNGKEAAEALGRATADDYLERRARTPLEPYLEELRSRIPQGATYRGAELVSERDCVLKLTRGEHELRVPVGSVTRVGAILRLHTPAGGRHSPRPRRSLTPPKVTYHSSASKASPGRREQG